MAVNESLRRELLAMRDADLSLRDRLARDGSLFRGYHPLMADLHRIHNRRLREILAAHGWPGRTLVGEDGAAAASLLLQHAILDPDLMRGAVPLIEQAVLAGEASGKTLALLVDRIATSEGRLQPYGTQHDWDEAGTLSPLPIEDPENVDARRASVGLEPLAANTRRLRAQAEAEGDRPPADRAAREREAAAWARSVGWRD